MSAAPALPACKIADVLTKYRGYAYWHRSLLDPTYRLPSTYAPGDMRSTSYAGLNGGFSVRRHVIADLKAMASAARAAGARVVVQSAYRSYSTQKATFDYWVRVHGYATALKESARAGHSEHQLGTTVDFRSIRWLGAVELLGLGNDQGRRVAESQRLEVRLRHVVPEGQDRRHVLPVRALALPVCRADPRAPHPIERPDAARIPVAGAEPDERHAYPDSDSDTIS